MLITFWKEVDVDDANYDPIKGWLLLETWEFGSSGAAPPRTAWARWAAERCRTLSDGTPVVWEVT